MTSTQRIEKLLNKASNTIDDLPNVYPIDLVQNAYDAAMQWYVNQYSNKDDSLTAFDALPLYICYLADIIDRLEWALTNKTNEVQNA